RCDRDADAADAVGGRREAELQARPRVAEVDAAPDATPRAVHAPVARLANALPAGGEHGVRMRRVDRDVANAGAVVDGEDAVPARSRVFAQVEAAIGAGRELRSHRGHEDATDVLGIDGDARDAPGRFESEELPGRARVLSAEHAGAVVRVHRRIGLAG